MSVAMGLILPLAPGLLDRLNSGGWTVLNTALGQGPLFLSAVALAAGAILRVSTLGRTLGGWEITILLGSVSIIVGALLLYGGSATSHYLIPEESLTYVFALAAGYAAVVR
jgi:hypothetical protein